MIAFLSGMGPGDLRAFEGHLAACGHCRTLLSLIARSDSVSSSSAVTGTASWWPRTLGHDRTDLIPGTHVGRYVLRERLGGGAMGVVFAAHDPELDRTIAVKVLRGDTAVESSRALLDERLMREAQAMAQLAHPNVVAVHDIGTFGDHIFIAMELVDGQTLAQWLAAKRRPVCEVLAVFIAAGRGLAAAHAVGLVHRDFKPENVLLGSDGRARVTDFGLARRSAMPGDMGATSTGVAERGRTTTAALAGTPFFMAPEQLAGERVDARSDQFSFCVAIYAALTGEHPFRSGDRTDVRLARRPRRDAMPSWLWCVLRRGLSADRDHRYPAMDALLARLATGPRRRRQLGLGVALALVALIAGVAVYRGETGDRGPTCEGAERLLEGVWDRQRAAAVGDAFRASGRVDAATTFASASLLLDQYARRWVALRTQACEAARDSGLSESVLNLRIGCLDARLSELRELTSRLASANGSQVDLAVAQIQALGPLPACSDDEALQRSMQPDLAPRPSALLALDAARSPSYFVTDSEDTLWQIRTDPEGAYRERLLVVDAVRGRPAVIVDADRRAHVLVRRTERTLWHGWQDEPGGAWHGHRLTESVTDDPSVVLAANKLVYFVRRADGWLWRYWQDAPSSDTWTGTRVADAVTGRPGVGFDPAGDLYLFVRKADGSLWYARQRADAIERPVKLSEGVAGDPTFVLDAIGKMTYYARRTDGQLMTGYQEVAGSRVWHRFLLTSHVVGDPSVTSDLDGKQICMIRKTDGSLWQGTQDGPGIGPWHETIVTGGLIGDPAVIRDADDRITYVVRKAGGSLWQGRQDAVRGATSHEHVLTWSALVK